MRYRLIVPAIASVLVLGLACSGSGTHGNSSDSENRALPASTAASLTAAVMGLESATSATNLPSLAPAGEEAFALLAPATPGCIAVTNHGTGGDGFTEWVWTFNCTGADGASLTGAVTLRFNAQGVVNVAYSNFRMAKGTQSWTYNGSRSLAWNRTTHLAAVTVSGLTLVVADSANPSTNATYSYNAAYSVDASQASAPKLWGTFTFNANGTTTSGSIAQATPLAWSPGCCYPLAGTLKLTQGPLSANVTFTAPCGTISVQPTGMGSVSHTLPPCVW